MELFSTMLPCSVAQLYVNYYIFRIASYKCTPAIHTLISKALTPRDTYQIIMVSYNNA